MKNHCALCTNGHLFIALRTFHLYGNETMSSPGLFACLSCPGEETRESQEVFYRGGSVAVISGATKGKRNHVKEMPSVTASQKSHLSEECTFVQKSMIAVFVLESTSNFSDKQWVFRFLFCQGWNKMSALGKKKNKFCKKKKKLNKN